MRTITNTTPNTTPNTTTNTTPPTTTPPTDTTPAATSHSSLRPSGRLARRTRDRLAALLAVLTAAAIGYVAHPPTAGAQGGSQASVYVPMSPCRIRDTRPDQAVGGRGSPLGPGETMLQQVTGTNGNCAVPGDATAVAMNVTAVDGTARSYLTVYPADLADRPTVSSLNWSAGQAPTPNKVDATLSPSGALALYNASGSVHLVVDVVGYYSPSTLTAMSQRIAALESDLAAATARVNQLTSIMPFSVGGAAENRFASGTVTIMEVTLTAPAQGTIVLNSSVSIGEEAEYAAVLCSITTREFVENSHRSIWTSSGGQNGSINAYGSTSLTRQANVEAGETVTYRLVCDSGSSTVYYVSPSLTAMYLQGYD